MLFRASAGDLSGDTFLIVDFNAVAGYQAGQDYVIRLDAGQNLGALSVADFV